MAISLPIRPTAAPFPSPRPILPGLVLCLAVTGGAFAIEAAERALLGRAWIEALVLAIIIGMGVRSLWTPGVRWHPGIAFGTKALLEIAVMLLGVSVSAATIAAAGPALLAGVAMVVTLAITLSFAIGRLLGLPARMALLIACGNSICGNSAIAAVAPVIEADGDDVAAAIAFTAALGAIVVLGLPLLGVALGMDGIGYGAFTGLTVYAVPQVIAAAAPMGPAAMQMGMLVKLMRVLMLGPVCLILSLIGPRSIGRDRTRGCRKTDARARHASPSEFVPWFIIGFLLLVACRSLGIVPAVLISPAGHLASLLMVVSMAALGLGVDVRTIAGAGSRVTTTVVLSLAGLGTISLLLLKAIHLA